ncbi:TraM recognition domain-containing protein [Pseudomonas aeruginosa]|uniref:TraM recognition domain-containing protein n=1 Tax=Pseudomonas aeruginosa TaxID=287 RepID=UPI000AFA40AE|nr:TraM recognition domain-containing protein [Pseudomonas aeruginosa]
MADAANDDVRLYAAARYWLSEYPEMPEKTAGSIVGQIRTWLGNILLHQHLGPWVNTTENAFKVEDVLTGTKLGLLLPESQYGVGGVAISALCMRRVYDAVKKRGDNWRALPGHQAVLVAADEVQNLLTRADLETVPVARSLGLYLMFATQNIDGLYKRLEKDGAVQMLGNLASIIGVVCGRGRNPTLRLWPTIFSGKIDVFPGDRRSRLISSMTSVAPA